MKFVRIALWPMMLAAAANAQPLRSLKTVAIPEPPGLSEYVRDRAALVALGKIFFWDMQAGSDGRTACATCHFHAGADHRPQNMLSDPNAAFPVNRELSAMSFPLRLLSDPGQRDSTVLRDTGARVGSAGAFRRIFEDIVPGQAAELGRDGLDKPEFMQGGLQVRRVTSRNTPTVFNSVFSVRSFWDGRASRIFNGFTPAGNTDEDAPGVLVWQNDAFTRQRIRLDNSGLASQAAGPALDHLEMSYAGRTWPKLGKKLLSLVPLALQRVSVNDSVLGAMARSDDRGLEGSFTYLSLIQTVFVPRLWESFQLVDAAGEPLAGRTGAAESTSEFTQAEYNFGLFWSLALQAYQATLVSADSPFDRFMDGDRSALTAEQQDGQRFFENNGRCTECHAGPEFSVASFTSANAGRGNHAFERTGARPVQEDLGEGNGRFKSIGLRNIEFTGPYFHNGGQATLEQVIDFYRRAGDFTPVHNDIRTFAISAAQKAALVAFLTSLTDDRVRFERAPFDHPELCVPVGHTESEPGVLAPGPEGPFSTSAAEKWRVVPAVGAGGNQAPLRTFDEMLRGIGSDGTRSHLLDEACTSPLP